MSTWLEDLVSTLRSEIANTQELLEHVPVRVQANAIMRNRNPPYHRNPESLSAKTLANELAKRLALDRFASSDPFPYDELCSCLSPLKDIRDALYNSELHTHVKFPPYGMAITDGRMPIEEFAKILLKQVFESKVDE